jgi:hypothetical protein
MTAFESSGYAPAAQHDYVRACIPFLEDSTLDDYLVHRWRRFVQIADGLLTRPIGSAIRIVASSSMDFICGHLRHLRTKCLAAQGFNSTCSPGCVNSVSSVPSYPHSSPCTVLGRLKVAKISLDIRTYLCHAHLHAAPRRSLFDNSKTFLAPSLREARESVLWLIANS